MKNIRLLLTAVLVFAYWFGYVCASNCTSYWTGWLDRDDPTGTGDWELYQNFVVSNDGPPCAIGCEPIDANCRVKYSNIPWNVANEVIPLSNQCTTKGLSCENKDQPDGYCQDYEIQFLCNQRNYSNAIYDNCVEAHWKACQAGNSTDGRYLIKSRTTIGFEVTECHSAGGEYIGSGCTGSGWTFIGIFEGNNSTNDTSYDSAIWTAKGDDQTNFNSQFWSANVTEVCLTSDAFSIQFPVNSVQAPSLRSLFFQKNTLNISNNLWSDALEDGITDPAFEENCYETGFNVGDRNYVQARIGIVNLNNPGAGCTPSGPQAIGVGMKVAGQGYGSVHGVVSGDNLDDAYQDVSVYVRSKPDPRPQ